MLRPPAKLVQLPLRRQIKSRLHSPVLVGHCGIHFLFLSDGRVLPRKASLLLHLLLLPMQLQLLLPHTEKPGQELPARVHFLLLLLKRNPITCSTVYCRGGLDSVLYRLAILQKDIYLQNVLLALADLPQSVHSPQLFSVFWVLSRQLLL